MKVGTEIQYYLIVDDRFTTEILPEINNLFNKLADTIEGKMRILNLHAISPRLITWADGSQQYRIECTLQTLKPMSKNEAYILTNSIQAHPLKFNSNKIRLN